MSDPSYLRRLSRAKEAATEKLKETRCKIVPSDNSEVCFLAVRKKEIRMIRVVVDEITAEDIKLLQGFDDYVPTGICTKEIWCKKEGQRKFLIQEV